jgi:hypothetical protein
MVTKCKDVLCGTSKPVEGMTTPSDLGADVVEMKKVELYIASEAFLIVTGLLDGVASGSSSEIKSKIDAKPIAPGIMLFMGVLENAFKSSGFLQNQLIVQNMFSFRVCYSISEGQSWSDLTEMMRLQNIKASYNNVIKRVMTQMSELDIFSPDAKGKFEGLMAWKKMYDAYLAENEELIKKLGKDSISLMSDNTPPEEMEDINGLMSLANSRMAAISKLL